jgi:hypothetical protein
VHDGTQIEKRGKPAAVICTASFVAPGRAMARTQGLNDYRFALIPHPLSSLREEQVRERAREVLPQVLEILGAS